jgi:hypothetical protein
VDPRILKQTSRAYRNQFPAFFTKRSGITKELLSLISSMFSHGVGQAAVASIISEHHSLRYHRQLSAYHEHIQSRLAPGSKQSILKLVLQRPATKPLPFGEYGDKNRYNGATITGVYLNTVFCLHKESTKEISSKHTALPGQRTLAGDHTFALAKMIAKILGKPLFTAVWTTTNELSELRKCMLVLSKSEQA